MGWLGTWAKRLGVVIDSSKIGTSLTDFPLALLLSDSSGTGDFDVTDLFTDLGSSSKKIAVMATV